jgi:hypothetical protein
MHQNVVVVLADISGQSHGLKETPKRRMTVTNEISTDQLEIGLVLKSVLNYEIKELPYYPQYFMVPV